MKIMEQEFFSVSHAVSINLRKDIWGQGKQKWEVFLRLTSGSQIVMAREGTKKEARAYAKVMADNIMQLTGCALMLTNGGTTLLVLDAVTRVYVDSQENGFVTLVEDVSSVTHQVHHGNKKVCEDAMAKIAQGIVMYQAQKGGANFDANRKDD